MSLLLKAKKGITKAAQKAAAVGAIETFLDEFPEIFVLNEVDSVSIKILDVAQVGQALEGHIFGGRADFHPIKFHVRDERDKKRAILAAQLVAGRGLVLHEVHDETKELLVVTLPQHSSAVLGKIEHPCGNTLFKIAKSQTEQDELLVLNYSNSTRACFRGLHLLKVPKLQLQTLKAGNMLFDDRVFKLRQGPTSLVKIRPKTLSATNTYVVEFTANAQDLQVRSLGLAIALLLTLSVAFEDLVPLLQKSIDNQEDSMTSALDELSGNPPDPEHPSESEVKGDKQGAGKLRKLLLRLFPCIYTS